MEQRPLRLGDLVDDYCPRERRVTDHAVVAMIDDAIKQTRCTACDSEHAYKGGKAPRRKKAPVTARLYKEVLAGLKEAEPEGEQDAGEMPSDADDVSVEDLPVAVVSAVSVADVEPVSTDLPADEPPIAISAATDDDMPVFDEAPDEGPVHRPLIRATLPRPEGVKAERPIPDFTIRHNGNGRPHGNANFRDARGAGKGRGNGQQRFNRGPGAARQGRGGGGGGSGFGGGRPGGGSRRRGR
ncbi:MAG TPA: hypothetical protein VL262_17760 [Vicinamibacterales bacterium]|jgi:hypothetical protein|nr:hypothetical protein [Vicinamibacterales bacterium]